MLRPVAGIGDVPSTLTEAADHQKRLEDMLRVVRAAYPEATLAMRERRQRRPTPVVRARPPGLGTGRLNDYAER